MSAKRQPLGRYQGRTTDRGLVVDLATREDAGRVLDALDRELVRALLADAPPNLAQHLADYSEPELVGMLRELVAAGRIRRTYDPRSDSFAVEYLGSAAGVLVAIDRFVGELRPRLRIVGGGEQVGDQ